MKNCKEYLFVSHGFGIAVLLVLVGWAADPQSAAPMYLWLAQFFLGLMQLIVGIYFLVSAKKRPEWFKKRIKDYWGITIAYFLLLWVFYHADFVGDRFFNVWLFIVPWGIALFQYMTIRRLYTERNRCYEELVVEEDKKI